MNTRQEGEHGAMEGDGIDTAGIEPEAGTAARYHRVLMLLPRGYREQRGEEMLGVMLDAAQDAGRDRPTLGEALSVLGLSLRLRTGAAGASARGRSVGETLRLTALLGTMLQMAAFAMSLTASLGTVTAENGSLPGLYGQGRAPAFVATCGLLCPVLAIAALLRGRRIWGAALAINPVVFLVEIAEMSTFGNGSSGSADHAFAVLGLCAIPAVAGAFGFQSDAPRVARPRLWFAATILLGVVAKAVDYVNNRQLGSAWPVAANIFALGCACIAVGVALHRARHSAVWPVALMVAGAPLLLLIPHAMTALSYDAEVPLLNALSFPGSMYAYIGLYGLGAEVLLALTLAATLLRRTRIVPAAPASEH
jgi:hypothetical protein